MSWLFWAWRRSRPRKRCLERDYAARYGREVAQPMNDAEKLEARRRARDV